ncbi:hypothetical protein ACFY2R_04795 [Micromonospora olivasterospora]|uniref:Uncharacterized protein n=1 Tax=Micromonospora olivasterospora TaxID=1880 RepID=A0A562I9I8_MICOL|nr:hypothetical protein [Micromonospora olivasterospora]TWH67395.1 hypothetical protein JD77_02370 [Micromonospora olivasterospora]
MSQDLPIPRQDDRSPDGAAVVEWGGAEPTPPGRAGQALAGLTRDHRFPLVPAGLGAVAAFASLAGEWLVMTVPNSGPEGNSLRVPFGVSDLGGFGTTYLVGLIGLVAAVALALRGTAAARRNARVAGLALAAAVLGLLIATTSTLDDAGKRALFYTSEGGFIVEYGRGLGMAFVACALLAAALHLAGRLDAPGDATTGQGAPGSDAPGGDGSSADGTGPGREPGRAWHRRRGAGRSRADDLPPAPADLTVQPTTPFARPEPPR